MGMLTGKNILVTGILTNASIGFHVARLAELEGATVVVTGAGRMSLVRCIAERLPSQNGAPPPVLELDVTNNDHLDTLADRLGDHVAHLDGVVHSIGFAPQTAMGGNFLHTPWADVATAMQISAFSLKALAVACLPLLKNGSSLVGLTLDATVAWPIYDWMGVAKASLESICRYLARDLGPHGLRVNLVASGPTRTLAERSIPSVDQLESLWSANRTPLRWNMEDPEPTARAVVALLSEWFPATTGEIIHVDGGAHAVRT